MNRVVFPAFVGLALMLCSPFAAAGQPPPGDYNYNIGSSNCTPLTGVSVKIKFNKRVVSNGIGFGFQLSAWSLTPPKKTPPYIVWQQYMTGVDAVNVNPPFINPMMQTFGAGNVGLVLGWGYNLLNLGGAEIPANYELTIALLNDGDDNTGNVTGGTFTVTDNKAKSHTKTRHLKYLPNFKNGDLAPIVGFEFNFNGGTGNILSVPGSPGATYTTTQVPVGTITYTASSPMTNFGTMFPPCAASQAITAETTNGFYGVLTPAQGSSTTFTQPFGVTLPPTGSSGGGSGGGRTVGTTCAQLGSCAPAHVPSKLDTGSDPPEAQKKR